MIMLLYGKFSAKLLKHQQTIPLNGGRSDPKAVYNFHESIVNALRPTLKEGVRSIIIASPAKTSYAQEFLNHIKAHHSWLLQGRKQSNILNDNRFSEHATASSSLNKNSRVQTVNSRNSF